MSKLQDFFFKFEIQLKKYLANKFIGAVFFFLILLNKQTLYLFWSSFTNLDVV